MLAQTQKRERPPHIRFLGANLKLHNKFDPKVSASKTVNYVYRNDETKGFAIRLIVFENLMSGSYCETFDVMVTTPNGTAYFYDHTFDAIEKKASKHIKHLRGLLANGKF